MKYRLTTKIIMDMKKLLTFLFFCLSLAFLPQSHASVATPTATAEQVSTDATKLSIQDLKTLSIKEIETKLGQELNFKQKLALKLLKAKAAKAEKHPDKPAGNGNTILGLLLGFVLGLIGVLIAYLAFKDQKDTIKGAWIGLAIWVVLLLLLI
jgi:hypothetical protein